MTNRKRWYVPLPMELHHTASGAQYGSNRVLLDIYSVKFSDIRRSNSAYGLTVSGCCAYAHCDYPQWELVPPDDPRHYPQGASALRAHTRRVPGARRLRFVMVVYADGRTAPRTNRRAPEAGTYDYVYHLRCLRKRVQQEFAAMLANERERTIPHIRI